jgi:hypothetical protein
MRLGTPLVVGLLMIVAMFLVQTLAITAVVLLMRSQLRANVASHWRRNVLIAGRVLAVITAAKLVQIAAWAAVFVGCGEFADFASAFYHSAVNFTTLGYGDVVMSPAWKLLGPLEAVAGMLMLGVSTAVLFAVIDVVIRRDPAVAPVP